MENAGENADHASRDAAIRALDPESVRQSVRALDAAGQTLDALQILAAYQAKAGAADVAARFGADIRTLKLRAFARYNAHREAGDIAQAERYVAGLAALLPGHTAILEAAFDCNRLLGRIGAAAGYAISLLNTDTAHQQAVNFIATLRASPETAEIEIARRMALAFSPHAGRERLYQLRELDGAASAILSAKLDTYRIAQLQEIVGLAATIERMFPSGTRGDRWDTFYRLKINAIDIPALLAPDTGPAEDTEPPGVFFTSQGTPLDDEGVRAAAARLGACAVFFAAADERYVARYAKWYAATILANCDVPCLVIVHVIGCADRLPAIAASIGLVDPRLIFAGDSFDAAAVTAKVVDSPLDNPPSLPVAHFQSVRFLQLGALLRFNLPVLISDIDTLLQRGIADLLATHAQADVVFNENAHALSLADRLTANLLLVYPTANARVFARFLHGYLARHLQNPEIIRWIDQIGLLLARHYLCRLESARAGAFDTGTDINNVMYPAYAQNPYRFLSLYQGFDMNSLAGMLKPRRP